MAKKGEKVGAMGDTVFYRTPEGTIVDDQGNQIKGPIAKQLAEEYESKQQEKAQLQAEAKAAAEEAKRQAKALIKAERSESETRKKLFEMVYRRIGTGKQQPRRILLVQ